MEKREQDPTETEEENLGQVMGKKTNLQLHLYETLTLENVMVTHEMASHLNSPMKNLSLKYLMSFFQIMFQKR